MMFRRRPFALAATVTIAVSFPAFAQEQDSPNVGPSAVGASSSGARTLVLAQELYAAGLARGDAVTVLAAAQLAASVDIASADAAILDPARIEVGSGPASFTKRNSDASAPAAPAPVMTAGEPRQASKATLFLAANESEGSAGSPVTATAMLAKSRELAEGDDAVLALIDDATAETSRGRIGGAVEWRSALPAGQTDVWEIPFLADSRAEVAIIGDGDANLDAAVTDENGNVICYDVSGSDTLHCDWTPAWDGYFYVTVQNVGPARNSYQLLTN